MIGGKSKDVTSDFLIKRNRSWFVKKDDELSFRILSVKYLWNAKMTCSKYKNKMIWNRSWQTLILKDQIVNILVFEGCVRSLSQLCSFIVVAGKQP